MRKIRVLRKKIGEPWEITVVDGTAEGLQNELGGSFEVLPVASDVAVIVKEDRAFDNSRFNVRLYGLQTFGTVLIVGIRGGEYCDLPCPEIYVKK